MAIHIFVQLEFESLYSFSKIFFIENTIPSKCPFCQLFHFYDAPEGKKIYPTEHIGWTGEQILNACFS